MHAIRGRRGAHVAGAHVGEFLQWRQPRPAPSASHAPCAGAAQLHTAVRQYRRHIEVTNIDKYSKKFDIIVSGQNDAKIF